MIKNKSLIPLKILLFSFHGSNTMLISFFPLLLTYRGLNAQEIGWVLAIGPTVSIFAQPFWGFISDKFQTVRKVLIVTSVGLMISSFFYFQVQSLTLILVFGILFYCFQSTISPLADSLAQRRSEHLEVSFGTIRTWGSIGFAINSILVGGLLDFVGIQYLVIPYFSATIIILFISTRVVDVKVERPPIKFTDIRKLVKNPALILFLFVILIIAITHRTNDYYMSLYISELGGRDNIVGMAWFIGVISEAVAFAFAGKWFKKFHPLIFISLAGLIYGLRWFFYSLSTTPILIVLLQFLHGFSFGIFYIAAFSYVTKLIPDELKATGHLMFATVIFGISGIIASLGGGFIFDHFGGSTLYISIGFLAIIGSCLVLLYHIIMRRKSLLSG